MPRPHTDALLVPPSILHPLYSVSLHYLSAQCLFGCPLFASLCLFFLGLAVALCSFDFAWFISHALPVVYPRIAVPVRVGERLQPSGQRGS